jgi:hypothetical protein
MKNVIGWSRSQDSNVRVQVTSIIFISPIPRCLIVSGGGGGKTFLLKITEQFGSRVNAEVRRFQLH